MTASILTADRVGASTARNALQDSRERVRLITDKAFEWEK
jgi:hypothetical protein